VVCVFTAPLHWRKRDVWRFAALTAKVRATASIPDEPVRARGIAGRVGSARVDPDRHFTSRVIGGALIGIAVGRSVVHVNERLRGHR
jgi:hypothetical protein